MSLFADQEHMNIVSDSDLRFIKRAVFAAGAVVAAAAIGAGTLLYGRVRESAPEPAPAGTARIIRQNESQTIARIETLHEGKRIDCLVVIDQAKNVWSITC